VGAPLGTVSQLSSPLLMDGVACGPTKLEDLGMPVRFGGPILLILHSPANLSAASIAFPLERDQWETLLSVPHFSVPSPSGDEALDHSLCRPF